MFAERKIVKLRNEAIVSERFQKFAKMYVYKDGLFWLGFGGIAAGLVGVVGYRVAHFVSHFRIFNIVLCLGFYAGGMRQVVEGEGGDRYFGCGGCVFVCDAWAFCGRGCLRSRAGEVRFLKKSALLELGCGNALNTAKLRVREGFIGRTGRSH